MANWGYVAIDKTGKEIKGSRDAEYTGSLNERSEAAGTHRSGGKAAEYLNTGYQHQF